MIRKLINFIIDIMFILLLFYFIDQEFIKGHEVSITSDLPPNNSSNKVLLILIVLTLSCIFFPLHTPATTWNEEDVKFIYDHIVKMQEIIHKNK